MPVVLDLDAKNTARSASVKDNNQHIKPTRVKPLYIAAVSTVIALSVIGWSFVNRSHTSNSPSEAPIAAVSQQAPANALNPAAPQQGNVANTNNQFPKPFQDPSPD